MFPSRNRLYLLMFFSYIVVRECNGQVQGYDPAPKCEMLDCPLYTVIQSEKEFEIRNYTEALWTSSSPFPQDTVQLAYAIGASGLSAYYSGKNDQGVKIDFTAPVLIDFINPFYEVNYYVPKKYQNGTLPKPVNPKIKQVKLPKRKYAAVRRFDDDFIDTTIAVQIDALKKNLQDTPYQRAANVDSFSVAFYNTRSFTTGEVYEILIWFD